MIAPGRYYSPALDPPAYVPRTPYGPLTRRGLTVIRNAGGIAEEETDEQYVANQLPTRVPFRDPYAWARLRARSNHFGRGGMVARYRGRGARGSRRGRNARGRGDGRGNGRGRF